MNGVEEDDGAPASRYDAFVAASPQGSPYATSWWLDAVLGAGRWRGHCVERDGAIVAAWPAGVRRSRFGDVLVGAPLTPCLGPLLRPGCSRTDHNELVELLVDQFGDVAHVEARCSPAFDYWTPLHWRGFTQTSFYTWRLDDLADTERVFAAASQRVRRQVRKSQKLGVEVGAGTIDELVELVRLSFRRQSIEHGMPDPTLIRRIDEAAVAHGAREILVARAPDGRLQAGGLYVFDGRTTWYLLGGNDPSLRDSGAPTHVMWQAILNAAARGTVFDFEGSMLKHVEHFVRAFGGTPTPYSIVRRTSSRGYRTQVALKRATRRLLAPRH